MKRNARKAHGQTAMTLRPAEVVQEEVERFNATVRGTWAQRVQFIRARRQTRRRFAQDRYVVYDLVTGQYTRIGAGGLPPGSVVATGLPQDAPREASERPHIYEVGERRRGVLT